MSEGEGGFLGRWSRRKLDARNEAEKSAAEAAHPETPVLASPVSGAVPAAALSTETEPGPEKRNEGETNAAEETFDPAKLPRPLPTLDEIVPGMDMTPFFQSGVPEAIRNAALRKLWITDPAIRDFENPAREYAYDWNVPGGVPGSGELIGDHHAKDLLRSLMGDPDPEKEETPDEMTQPQMVDVMEPDAAVAKSVVVQESAEEAEVFSGNGSEHVATAKEERSEDVPAAEAGGGRRRHGGALPG